MSTGVVERRSRKRRNTDSPSTFRQRDVQHHQVERRGGEREVRRFAVAREIDCIGRLVQRPRERRRQDGVVFNDQDSHARSVLDAGQRRSAAALARRESSHFPD
jgi:hypothetical protein